MKRIVLILGCICLLNACSSQVEVSSQAANNVDKCPTPTTIPQAALTPESDLEQKFNYHIINIVADANTVKFQTLKQDFVFCRENTTWTVQPGTLGREFMPPKNYLEMAENLMFPTYKTLKVQGKTYQYRVVMEPNFFIGDNGVLARPEVNPEQDRIVFELIVPGRKLPQRQTLYTLKDIQQQAVNRGYSSMGVKLGPPQITSAIVHGDASGKGNALRLYWSLAYEQGEGNTGIATIISYDPQSDRFLLLQPDELWGQKITDLVVTGDPSHPMFWLGTNISGEGNKYIPAQGLVAYRPAPQNPYSGSVTTYNVHNSPLVGAIPDRLWLEDETLWVGTGNGVCQLKWQAADQPESWSCWRWSLVAKLPTEGVPLYSSLTSETPAMQLSPNQNNETVEVLWWSPSDRQIRKGRYEVRNHHGFTTKLDQGARLVESKRLLPAAKPPVYWPGFEWHWQGDRFVRGFDQVASNKFGGGPQGIGTLPSTPDQPPKWYAMRGDLELLQLSAASTSVKYYSGWVDENLLNLSLTVVPHKRPQHPQPNPLLTWVRSR